MACEGRRHDFKQINLIGVFCQKVVIVSDDRKLIPNFGCSTPDVESVTLLGNRSHVKQGWAQVKVKVSSYIAQYAIKYLCI